ncbi:MAG: hypothetical protein IPF99_35505, partial [Deltaproteobacteria bacterium]|nr:hypothetical protein [Deltaproteobacteria bacterium]
PCAWSTRRPGVTVRVGRTTLDAEAMGVLLPYDPAEVTVVAEAPGFLPSQQSVRLTAGGRASIELALRAAPAERDGAPAQTGPRRAPAAGSAGGGASWWAASGRVAGHLRGAGLDGLVGLR